MNVKKKRCFCFVFLLSLTFDSTVNSESLNHTAKYNQNQSMLAYASTIMEFTVVALVCCCCCYFFSRLRKFGEVISDILTTQSWHFAFCMCVYGCMLLDFFLISIRFFPSLQSGKMEDYIDWKMSFNISYLETSEIDPHSTLSISVHSVWHFIIFFFW